LPDKRRHRGAHPDDARLFAPDALETLRRAVQDYSWLLSNGYAAKSSLKLIGDRFSLTQRQRMAVMRSGCGQEDVSHRLSKQTGREALTGKVLLLDGYNVLTTVEAALAGGVILIGRDGCYRDIAGMHGTYRKVEETIPAIEITGQLLAELQLERCQWYLDRPVSNSGRLKTLLLEMAEKEKWNWEVELVYSPDGVLVRAEDAAATSDSEILNRCRKWFNLAREVIDQFVSEAWVIDLGTLTKPL
jgi:hypothetical protein